MIPQTIIEAIAAHNKKGNSTGINPRNYAVKQSSLRVPYMALGDFIHLTVEQALDDFIRTGLEAAQRSITNEKTELLGYDVLVEKDDPANGDVVILRVFAGRALSEVEKETYRQITEAISELSEADKMEYNAMLTALRKVLSPAAFDAYRKALSLAGVTRNQWNQEINKGRIPRYTGPADGSVIFYPGTRFSEPEKK